MQPLFKLSPGPLLKSGLGHLASITPTRRLSFDQGCKDLGRGHYLSRTQRKREWVKMRLSFKLSHGQLLKSGLGPDIALIRCMIKIFGDHKFR